jgi:hypothetical protein
MARSSLAYIPGFSVNIFFSLCLYSSNLGTFWLKLEQFWPFEEFSIFSNSVSPLIPTSNQDGHQAQNKKRGDEILIVHCCFSVSQNEHKF